jgi:hypothetical protein
MILPANVSDIGSMIAMAMNVINRTPTTPLPPSGNSK